MEFMESKTKVTKSSTLSIILSIFFPIALISIYALPHVYNQLIQISAESQGFTGSTKIYEMRYIVSRSYNNGAISFHHAIISIIILIIMFVVGKVPFVGGVIEHLQKGKFSTNINDIKLKTLSGKPARVFVGLVMVIALLWAIGEWEEMLRSLKFLFAGFN